MENVFTGRADCACINATTVDESMPPDRKAPSGTSAIICAPTASFSKVSSWSTACCALPVKGLATPLRMCCSADQ